LNELVIYALIPLCAYLLGAIPFGLILCRAIKGVDIRERGSRNIGATNAGRVCGRPFFVAAFALDFGKGLAPVLLGPLIAQALAGGCPGDWFRVAYGLCAIVGHTFPVYLRFRGGKAVATSFGVFVALAPVAALIALGVWVIVFLPFRYVSLASMAGAVAAPVAYAALHRSGLGDHLPVLVFSVAIPALIIFRHRGNIRRLLRGTENRFGNKKT